MAAGRILTAMALLGALAAAPASADDRQRGRERSDRRDQQREERADGQRARGRGHAVARSRTVDRQIEVDRQRTVRQYQSQRGVDSRRHVDVQRQVEVQRRYDSRRVYARPGYSNRGYYGSRTVIVPRVIRPSIVTVVPYRPYVYRPRIGIGVYYGSGGYPYGYTPRGYYDPIPGRAYGGLRITDAPRDAHVFADGYYVGIVNDFDGVFQHLNLEAGPHHIEVRLPGYDDEAVAFDVIIQPGRTVTFRADW
jgi:hypothetical protein